MGKNSAVDWCDHSFVAVKGCTKTQDPGCQNCYAEREVEHRFKLTEWGPLGERKTTTDAYWKKPLAWNAQAWSTCLVCGWRGPTAEDCPDCGDGGQMRPTRQTVFASPWGDIFEEPIIHAANPDIGWRNRAFMEDMRWRLWELIGETTNLVWLLLTKRPENVRDMVPPKWLRQWPHNVWTGLSASTQPDLRRGLQHLVKVPGPHFLSLEPLLGEIDIPAALFMPGTWDTIYPGHDCMLAVTPAALKQANIRWVIAGGESGPEARPTRPEWARGLRDQCIEAGVLYFFKQWGEWQPADEFESVPGNVNRADIGRFWRKEDGAATSELMVRVGKKEAGHLLDDKAWRQQPDWKEGATEW